MIQFIVSTCTTPHGTIYCIYKHNPSWYNLLYLRAQHLMIQFIVSTRTTPHGTIYCIYTHNPSWYNLCHITQRPPLFCNSLCLRFVDTFRAISKINLFPKVSRYVLTLRSRTTSHRYTERQESTCTHAYTTDSTFLCNPCSLWPGNEHSLFAKTTEQTARDTM
jgi:hypothetical protein